MSELAVKKKPYKSKTLWLNVIVAIIAMIPGVSEKVSPEQIALGLGGLNMILRLVTKDKIGLNE